MSKLSERFQNNLSKWLVAAIIAGGISCSNENVPFSSVDVPIGEVSIGVKLSKLAAATMVRAEVIVTAADMDTVSANLEIVGDVASGIIRGIPVGQNRKFTINGYDNADQLIYSGTTLADVAPRESTDPVRVILRPVTQEEPPSSVLTFEGSGNGTTGTVSLEKGVYTITVNKNQDVSVSVHVLNADTGSEVLFGFLPLISFEGFGQSQLAKSFVVTQGSYILNIESSSNLTGWKIVIGKAKVSSSSFPLTFSGEGNGTTDVIFFEKGNYTITLEKSASVSVSAHFLDAETGTEVLFGFLPLISFEGFGQTQIKKGFVLTLSGQYVINFESSSALGPWTATIE